MFILADKIIPSILIRVFNSDQVLNGYGTQINNPIPEKIISNKCESKHNTKEPWRRFCRCSKAGTY